jgi:hypothetical protein
MELKMNLNEQLADRFMTIKEHTGMKDDKNVLAYLISKEYDKIQETRFRKVFVGPETYERLEKKATARGETVDIYVQELVENQLKKSEA